MKIALRMRPEESYLKDHIPAYLITRAIEDILPKGKKVLAFTDIPYAYTGKEVIVSYQSALGESMQDWLYCDNLHVKQPQQKNNYTTAIFPPSKNIFIILPWQREIIKL